jgi:threonine dehydrogenase-like Zn-dependent dehydrogenase
MRAAVFAGPRFIEVGDRPDPVVAAPTDAVVRVALASVCGSDLWYYRGESPHALGPIGHEFTGVVEQVGSEVRTVSEGDIVVAPFRYSEGTCAHCRAGWTSSCVAGGVFGVTDGIDGGQGEDVRVPLADGGIAEAYAAADERRAIKSLVRVGTQETRP